MFDTTYVLALVGVGLLLVGGESLVRGAVGIAMRHNISVLFVGLVIVGFGTSVPELAVSLDAAFTGKPDIALGNVVGSNIANILLILGVSALIRPLSFAPAAIGRDTMIMIGASLAFFILAQQGILPGWIGAMFLATLAGFIIYSYMAERSASTSSPERLLHEREARQFEDTKHGMKFAIALTLGGMVGVVWGARIFVDSAVKIAHDFGVSEAAIGLTMVALGTSLPELVTALIAAYRKETDVIVGNVIGSNIFNILGILGATLLVTDIVLPHGFFDDMNVFLLVTLAVAPFLLCFGRIRLLTGLAFLASYVAYVIWVYQGNPL
ncbi:MAG: calcium/sodium antiporter [Alphaproteobacteria bacterium]|nr:calcium/sodium antiporter [Alphaproteobacteria bacterium]